MTEMSGPLRPAPALPGGPTAKLPMHFFWLLDGSSSMAGQKIQSLNFAVGDAIPPIRKTAESVTGLRLLVRALRFATDVDWIVREPTPINELQWRDIAADGDTSGLRTQACDMSPVFSFRLPIVTIATTGAPSRRDGPW